VFSNYHQTEDIVGVKDLSWLREYTKPMAL
jgi:hypothetical protein